MPRFAQAIGGEISTQQGELDQVVLRAAAANALVLSRWRRKRLDRSRKILAFDVALSQQDQRLAGVG